MNDEYQIRYIAKKWKLPRLQTLAIRGSRVSDWGMILENHNRIEKLELTPVATAYPKYPGMTTLSNLTHFYIGAAKEKLCFIRAPRLKCFGIFNIQWANSRDAISLAKKVHELFPTTRRVCLSAPILFETDSVKEHLREKGIELRVTPKKYAQYR